MQKHKHTYTNTLQLYLFTWLCFIFMYIIHSCYMLFTINKVRRGLIDHTVRFMGKSDSTTPPVHEVNIDSSPTAQLLHEGRGRDGDRGSAAPHSDTFGGFKGALVGAGGRGGHSVLSVNT